ncbi:unnamed protein product [Paramecium primaurelia]|uniref:Uncharacterized protein n=1 Tax=Paramecium primaurelia TaxID=5886 RepID=A0A8S1Q9P3_PARPR|nr:unnamed protein product [Paramecium primaurelia]
MRIQIQDCRSISTYRNGILGFQLKFGSQKQSQQTSNRTTLKRQFKISHQEFKKTQRLALLQSRSILGILANLPLSQEIPSFNKHMKIAYNIENTSIPNHFQTINFPVIPCSSKKITYLYMQVHYQKEIIFSPQPKIAQKPITQREDTEMSILHQIQKNFRKRTKASSQIIDTLEYFNLINQTLK